jgi:fibronectin type III domain protein
MIPRNLWWCLLITAGALFWITPAARSQDLTLAWDPSLGNIAGYFLYWGTVTESYSQKISVGNTTMAIVSNLSTGQTYFFAVTAYNSDGLESGYSNQVRYTVPAVTSPKLTAPAPTPRLAATPLSSPKAPGAPSAHRAGRRLPRPTPQGNPP